MTWDTTDNSKTLDDDFTSYTAELKEGQLLGANQNYRLVKNLGVGGMGEAWLASKILDGTEIRQVVVKTIRSDRRGDEGAQEKALKQFQLIQSLNHQNICPIYDFEKDPTCGYIIVRGYAEGRSYADWFGKQPKPLDEVCKVLRPIADALDFAHSKGVIHRDVKPENMMFTADGTSWLIDFGIATHLRSEAVATMDQFSSSGTISYMAPEQKKGELQTAQTDEYSLAMVALEFLAGSLSPLAFSRLLPEVQKVLGKALSETPGDRYVTCREFIDALSGMKPLSPPPPAPPAPTMAAVPQTAPPKPTPAETPLPESSIKAGERKILTADGIEYAFRWCPPGEFLMGWNPPGEIMKGLNPPGDLMKGLNPPAQLRTGWSKFMSGWNKLADGKPIHKVQLTKGFWILETPITQAMWQNVMGKNPSWFNGKILGVKLYKASDRPVERVSWNDCQEFCSKLSQKLDQQVKLPTEAQWEYACRTGKTSEYASIITSVVSYYKWGFSRGFRFFMPHKVRQKEPNAWGVYDMQGDVLEWCSDYYDQNYFSRSPESDPENTSISSFRVCRGYLFARRRFGCPANSRFPTFGFRILLVPSQEE